MIGVPQLSLAITLAGLRSQSGMVAGSGLQPKSTLGGHFVNTGFVVSVIVMICVQFVALPHGSTAVHTRVMTRGQSPAAESTQVGLATAPQVLLAVAKPVTDGSALNQAVHSSVASAGQTSVRQGAGTKITCTAAEAGCHVAPPSRLNSVNTSKKL